MNNSLRSGLNIIFLCALCVPSAIAGIRIDFSRSDRTYDWLTTFDYNISRPGFEFRSDFNGESNLVKGSLNRWQENATAKFRSQKTFYKSLSLVSMAGYTVNSLDKRRARTSELAAGVSYKAAAILELRPMITADSKRSDLDRQRNDQGVGYAIEGNLLSSKFMGFDVGGAISYDHINLTNIPADEGSGSFNASSNFRSDDTISVALRGLEAAKKYYSSSSSSESIVKQIKQERTGDFALSMALPAAFRIRVEGNAHLSRYLYRYSLLDEGLTPPLDNYERNGGYKASLSGRIDNLAQGILSYAWRRTRQLYQGSGRDQQTEMGELSFQGKMHLSDRDSLLADILFGVTSYSSPGIFVYGQDRDQKTILFNGRYRHDFSPYFSGGAAGGVNSFHQIYIFGAQSANNGRNDTYIMTPFARWRPFENSTILQTFDIQANYITFDFDRKKTATRNRIFRRATSRSDLELVISKNLTWKQSYIYRYEDYGQLIWNEGWQQAVSWDRRRNGIETRFVYSPGSIFQITPSFAWEKTNDFNHSVKTEQTSQELIEIRNLADEQVKLLFEIDFTFNWDTSRRLKADFAHRVRKFMSRPRENNDYATISLEYMF